MFATKPKVIASASTPPPPIAARTTAKRTKTSRACSACRNRRTRCTGGVPCRKCCESHTTCVIDHETDNRRKIMFMRKISALEDTIAKILETLRDEEKSEWFIPLVRNNTSTAEIQQILAKESSKDTSSELSTEPEAISLKEGDGRVSRPSDIRGIMAIEHLI